jgi:hypothetical protein
MLLDRFRRIFKGDYPKENQELVEKLAGSINNGFEVLYNATNKNLSLDHNIACTVKKISTKVTSAGVPTSTLSFKVDTAGQIKGISVIRATNLTNSSTYVTSHPFITFSQDGSNVTVSHISGLPVSNEFELTVVAWA